MIGDPLDGSDNPQNTRLGDSLDDITGVVTQAFGYYRILPTTNIAIVNSQTPDLPPPTTLVSNNQCDQLTIGSYNVDNLSPFPLIASTIASHIVTLMKTPTLIFLQEIQDDSGATNDGNVSANLTLSALVNSIQAQSGVTYAYAEIDPLDGQDGGLPGGNIRVAYLYNPQVIRLHNPNPGNGTDTNAVLAGPELKYNPGRIAPTDVIWTFGRKPLAAVWETLDGNNKFFTVNVYFGGKGGSSPIEGDARPPINGGVELRIAQTSLVAVSIPYLFNIFD